MLAGLLVVLHVWSVFWLVGGIVGRDASYARAAQAADLDGLQTLAGLGGFFDRVAVRPATSVVLATGLVAAYFRGYPILGFMQGGAANWVLVSLLVYLSIIPVIVLVFLPKGRVYRTALAEAIAKGEVTDRLRRSIADPVLGAARGYEIVMIGVLSWLMVTQPF